jgi:hypothetical protein
VTTGQHRRPPDDSELHHDVHRENRIFYKGFLALAATLAVAYIRSRWWV